MTDETPISLWDLTTEETALSPEMDGDITTDLAIIGDGFTGLSTALHAAERGIDCHVLEAKKIGFGGSMGRVIGGDKGLSRRWARQRILAIFPELADIEFEKFWHGQIAMTPDHLPRIFRLADGLYTPIGYNGRGITPGTMFGKAMADLVAGGHEGDMPLPVTNPSRVGSTGIRSTMYDAAFTAKQIKDAYRR